MDKIIKLLIIILFLYSAAAQSQTLSKQLWKMANECYSSIEPDDNGKIIPDELIDDSKNGYLKIKASWPTCGCGCSTTAGAYRDSKGKYTLIAKDFWDCDWKHKLKSNKDLNVVLPENFNISDFISKAENTETKQAIFYLDAEIPRIGTDTKFSIKLIPFGIKTESNNLLSFEYSEKNTDMSFYLVHEIVMQIKNSETLTFLQDGNFDKISDTDKEIINKVLNYGNYKDPMQEIKQSLIHLNKVYNLYSLIEHETFVFGWNRQKARFYIKEKGKAPKKMTFKEFLLNNSYWSPAC